MGLNSSIGKTGGNANAVTTTGGTSTDNAVARFDGTDGTKIQNSAVIVDDAGHVGIGMIPTQMLDITEPGLGYVGLKISGVKPAATGGSLFGLGTFAFDIDGSDGGDNSSGSAGRFAGPGQGVEWTLGDGGVYTGTGNATHRGGLGGGVGIALGTGGNATGATGAALGGDGGYFNVIGHPGGESQTHAGTSGIGSYFTFTGGDGGVNSVAGGTAGNGGSFTVTTGLKGVASGGASAGSDGAINLNTTVGTATNIGNSGHVTTIAGEILTPESSRVAGDLTAANTTFTNMTGISRTVLAAGNYVGELVIKCNNTAATEGIKIDFNGGTATMTNFWAAAGVSVGGTTVIGTAISTSLSGVINFTTITGETLIIAKISFVVNGAGTVVPRFAENSTAIGTVTVELGSFMKLEKVA